MWFGTCLSEITVGDQTMKMGAIAFDVIKRLTV